MTFHALIFSKVDYVDYALSAIAGLLSETDKSRLGAFFRKAKRRMVSAIVIFSSLNSSIEQITNSLNKFTSVTTVLTLFFQALVFFIPGRPIHLDPEDISSPSPIKHCFV